MSVSIAAVRSAVGGGTITIGVSPLDGPFIRRFLDVYFSSAPVAVRDARITEATGDRLVVTGTASLMGGDQDVTLTVAADAADDLTVVLYCRPAVGWRFSQGLAVLTDTAGTGSPPAPLLDRLQDLGALSDVELTLPAQDPPLAAVGGYELAATLHPARVTGIVQTIAGPANLGLHGAVVPQEAGGQSAGGRAAGGRASVSGITLTGSTPAVALGGVPLDAGELRLHVPWRVEPGTVPSPGGGWSGPVRLGLMLESGELRLYVPYQAVPGAMAYPGIGWSGPLRLAGLVFDTVIVTALGGGWLTAYGRLPTTAALPELSAIVGADELAPALPASLGAQLGLSSLGIESAEIIAHEESGAVVLDALAVTVGAPDMRWTLIEGVLAVTDMAMTFLLADPFGSDRSGRRISVGVRGTVELAGIACEVIAFMPERQLQAGLPAGHTLPLGTLLAEHLPQIPLPAELTITGLWLTADLREPVEVCIDAALADAHDFTIQLGHRDLGLTGMAFRVTHTPAGVSGLLMARCTIAGVDLSITAAHPQPGGGWEFSGYMWADQSVPLGSLIADLLPEDIALPEALCALTVGGVTLGWNTTTGAVAFGGYATSAWDLDLGPSKAAVEAEIEISTAVDARTGRRTTSGRLVGTLKLGGVTFTLTYDFAPQQTIVRGTWDGVGQLDYSGLVTGLGLDPSTINPDPAGRDPAGPDPAVPGLDLGLRSAAFELDLAAGDELLIQAQSTTYGAAFFAARRDPQRGWGFAFGLALPRARLSDLAGDVAETVNWLSFDTVLLLISSAALPTLRVPGFPPVDNVQPGVICAMEIDLAAAAAAQDEHSGAMARLREVSGHDRLLMRLNLGTVMAGLEADLEGGVTFGTGDNVLRLSNTRVILRPGLVTVAGALAFRLEDRTIDATARLNIGATQVSASVDLHAEDGYLPIPMGFKGVHLTDIGALLEIEFEPPQVGAGLAGAFVIGEPPTEPPSRRDPAAGSLRALPADNEFAFVFSVTAEAVNPQLLSLYIAEVSLRELIVALLDQEVELPDVLTEIRATELLLYWCDELTTLPNGTIAVPGFGMNLNLDLWGFDAHADLRVDASHGITGDACLDPIRIPGVLELVGDGPGTPETYQGQVTVKPGGAVVRVSTVTEPYLHLNWRLVLFDLASQTVDAEITRDGLVFSVEYQFGDVFDSVLSCSLRHREHFHLSCRLRLNADIGPIEILGVDLGTIHLADLAADVDLDVTVQSGVVLTLDASFDYDGNALTMPQLRLAVAPASLAELPGLIGDQIIAEAASIFGFLYDEAEQAVRAGLDEAESLAAAAAREVGEIADSISATTNEIAANAEAIAAAIAEAGDGRVAAITDEISQVGAQIDTVLVDAAQQLNDAAQQVGAIAVDAGQEVERAVLTGENAVVNAANAAGNTVGEAATEVAGVVAEAAQALGDTVSTVRSEAGDLVHDLGSLFGL